MSDQQGPASGEAAAPDGPFARLGADLDQVLQHMTGTEACEHFARARLEVLKGIRAIIDARIERLSSTDAAKGAAITVE
jgi:hypothetical protein